jgi:hypothetical protein
MRHDNDSGGKNRKALAPNEKQLSAEGRRRAVIFSNRDDKTLLELFLAGVAGWEAGLRRRFDHGKPVEHVGQRFTISLTRTPNAAAMAPDAILFIT